MIVSRVNDIPNTVSARIFSIFNIFCLIDRWRARIFYIWSHRRPRLFGGIIVNNTLRDHYFWLLVIHCGITSVPKKRIIVTYELGGGRKYCGVNLAESPCLYHGGSYRSRYTGYMVLMQRISGRNIGRRKVALGSLFSHNSSIRFARRESGVTKYLAESHFVPSNFI